MDVHNKVNLTLNGKPVANVRHLIIVLRNSGGKDLEAKDFAEPLRIVFPQGSEYVSVKTSGQKGGFMPEFTVSMKANEIGHQELSFIEMAAALMNSGDYARFHVLASMPPDKQVTVKGRIAGVKKLKEESGTHMGSLSDMNPKGKATLAALALGAAAIGFVVPDRIRFWVMESAILLLLAILAVSIASYMERV